MKILFCQRAFALRGNWGSQRTLHTFANRTSRHTNQNLQKSAI
jgi:predicted Rdx family selenoprotein